jgi:hypothetical protein
LKNQLSMIMEDPGVYLTNKKKILYLMEEEVYSSRGICNPWEPEENGL